MHLVPLNDRIIITKTDRTTTTEAGIILPDVGAYEEISQGRCVAAGPDVTQAELVLGKELLFLTWAGSCVVLNGVKWLAIKERDIIAIVDSSDSPTFTYGDGNAA